MGILDFFTGGGEYADPNAIDERYGVSRGDVRQAALNTLGNVSGLLLAAGQPMSGSQRAQLLGQLGPAFGGAQTDIYNAAQRRLLGAENEQKMGEMQRMRTFAERVKNDPEGVAAELGTTADVIKNLTPAQLQTIAANRATAAINVTPGERAMREALAKISPTVSQGEALAAGGGGPTNKAQSLFGQNKTQAQLIAQYNEVIPKLIGQGYVKEAADLAASLKAMAPAKAETVTVSPGSSVIDPVTGEVIYTAAAKPETVTVSPGSSVIDPVTGEVIYTAAAKPETFTLSPGQIVVSATGETIAQGPAEPQDRPMTSEERVLYGIPTGVLAVMGKTGPKVLQSTGSGAPSGMEFIPDPTRPGKFILSPIIGAKEFPAELGPRLGAIRDFFSNKVPLIEKAFDEGKFATDNYEFKAKLGANVGEAANIYRQFQAGQDALRRSLSGAALTSSEVDEYAARYLPQFMDTEETSRAKYRDLKSALGEIRDVIEYGRLPLTREQAEKIFAKYNPETSAAIPTQGNATQGPTDDELILKYGGN